MRERDTERQDLWCRRASEVAVPSVCCALRRRDRAEVAAAQAAAGFGDGLTTLVMGDLDRRIIMTSLQSQRPNRSVTCCGGIRAACCCAGWRPNRAPIEALSVKEARGIRPGERN